MNLNRKTGKPQGMEFNPTVEYFPSLGEEPKEQP